MAATSFSFIAPLILRRAARAFIHPHPFYINSKLSYWGTLRSLPLTTPLSSSGICHLAQAIKGDVDVLLKGVGDKSAIEDLKHILEMVLVSNEVLLIKKEVWGNANSSMLLPPSVHCDD